MYASLRLYFLIFILSFGEVSDSSDCSLTVCPCSRAPEGLAHWTFCHLLFSQKLISKLECKGLRLQSYIADYTTESYSKSWQ